MTDFDDGTAEAFARMREHDEAVRGQTNAALLTELGHFDTSELVALTRLLRTARTIPGGLDAAMREAVKSVRGVNDTLVVRDVDAHKWAAEEQRLDKRRTENKRRARRLARAVQAFHDLRLFLLDEQRAGR